VRYQYSDTTGRIRSVYTPAGTADTEIGYYYDPLGRLAEVEAAQLNSEPVSDITKYAYNAVGSLAIVDYNNGNLAEYTYDTLNRLTSLTNWQSASKVSALSSYTYTLGPDGQRTAATEQTAEGTTKIEWSYDNLNRLITEDYNAPADTNDFLHEYVYDLVGNRTKKTADANLVTTYSYNTTDQLEYETADGNTTNYEYDDNGALTLKDAGQDPNFTYSYDLRGRLSQVDIENGATVGYVYNPDGIRVRSTVDGSAIDYVVDPHNHTGYAQVLKQINSITGANTVYVTGLDVIAQATGTSAPDYMLYDGHGSVRALANNTGSVIESYAYDGYGNLHNFGGTPSTNLLNAGEFREPQTHDSRGCQYNCYRHVCCNPGSDRCDSSL
jgi:YD repeat-containing protein